MTEPKVNIVVCANDIKPTHNKIWGSSKRGIKSQYTYIQQFLMLYYSIKDNWHFNYQIVLIHSQPLLEKTVQILSTLDVKVLQRKHKDDEYMIRPIAYTEPMDCDFRLVLDCDMIAVNEPNFDYSKDALAMYGGNKYNKVYWTKICNYLGCKVPQDPCIGCNNVNRYKNWNVIVPTLYHNGKLKQRAFPYFNNGAIFIRNSISPEVGRLFEQYRVQYAKFCSLSKPDGQDIIGLAINQITDNWDIYQPGFNLCVNVTFPIPYNGPVFLLHYIKVPKSSPVYTKYIQKYSKFV